MKYQPLILFFIFLNGCGSNDHIHSATSPDGEYQAIAFFQNTITYEETHVSIYKAEGGMRYVDGNVLVLEGNIPVFLEWNESDRLTVEVHGRSKELLKNESVSGVRIKYTEKI